MVRNMRNIPNCHLNSEHECDPLIVRGIRSIVSTQETFLLYDTSQVWLRGVCAIRTNYLRYDLRDYLVLYGDIGAAMDPAIVLGNVRADACELTTKSIKIR